MCNSFHPCLDIFETFIDEDVLLYELGEVDSIYASAGNGLVQARKETKLWLNTLQKLVAK